jgi:peptidoglycan/xylan/chitin deacetylase (PgdA/CDA1 family)
MTLLYIISLLILLPILYIPIPFVISKLLKKINIAKLNRSDGLYITFDDGPSTNLTPAILDLLEKSKAKATFFLLGKHIEQNPALARQIKEKGHLIGEHSYHHTHPWRTGPIKSATDLIKGWNSFSQIEKTYRTKYFRPPYGKFNMITLLYVLFWRKNVIFWTEDPKDYMISTIDSFLEKEIMNITSGSIVLLHDGRARMDEYPNTTIDVLEAILEKSSKENLNCLSVDVVN